jgi:hypothetical protein
MPVRVSRVILATVVDVRPTGRTKHRIRWFCNWRNGIPTLPDGHFHILRTEDN